MNWTISTYGPNEDAPPAERWVAVIRRGDHLASFAFAPSAEEAAQKAERFTAAQNAKKTATGRKPATQTEEIEEAI